MYSCCALQAESDFGLLVCSNVAINIQIYIETHTNLIRWHQKSQQPLKVTTVSRLRRPRLALRVRVERLLHFLLLPLLSAAAFGPLRHLAEGSTVQ